jgi:hypothetical protein
MTPKELALRYGYPDKEAGARWEKVKGALKAPFAEGYWKGKKGPFALGAATTVPAFATGYWLWPKRHSGSISAEDFNLENIKEFAKKNPVATGAGALVGAAGLYAVLRLALQRREDEFGKAAESVSKSQQRFMGMVLATKKGAKPASPAVAKAARSLTTEEARKFAATKTGKLPEKVANDIAERQRMLRSELSDVPEGSEPVSAAERPLTAEQKAVQQIRSLIGPRRHRGAYSMPVTSALLQRRDLLPEIKR